MDRYMGYRVLIALAVLMLYAWLIPSLVYRMVHWLIGGAAGSMLGLAAATLLFVGVAAASVLYVVHGRPRASS